MKERGHQPAAAGAVDQLLAAESDDDEADLITDGLSADLALRG